MSIYFDETLGKTETIRHLHRWRTEISKLKKSTHFTREEVEKLFLVHLKITSSEGSINVFTFQKICHSFFGITDDSHKEKIYAVFDPVLGCNITPDSWVHKLSTILKGSLNEKIDFVWKVYSHNNYITREIISNFLRKAIIKKKGDAGFDSMDKDIVNLILKKLDRDLDGRVSYEDFRQSVFQNPLLLECLGPCLPTPLAAAAFLATFSEKSVRIRVLPFRENAELAWRKQNGQRHITFRDMQYDRYPGGSGASMTSATLR